VEGGQEEEIHDGRSSFGFREVIQGEGTEIALEKEFKRKDGGGFIIRGNVGLIVYFIARVTVLTLTVIVITINNHRGRRTLEVVPVCGFSMKRFPKINFQTQYTFVRIQKAPPGESGR